ncbi:acid-sensing ion channel 4-A-like [Sycon ciliatum]|uniref:acid-sensing ion channel 4-A-like n=1 Tax=Sycon ciliatum TaxID=27933 RepID=UPI0031F69B26
MCLPGQDARRSQRKLNYLLMRHVCLNQREFKQLLKQKGFQVDHFDVVRFRDQYARVEVFYEELNFENIVQKPAYEPENLLADMGGQLGLWLGFSVLAILEIIEYLIYMLLVALGKVKLPDEEDYLKARDD